MVNRNPKQSLLKKQLLWLIVLVIAIPFVSCDMTGDSGRVSSDNNEARWSDLRNWTCPGVTACQWNGPVLCEGACTWVGSGSQPNQAQRPSNPAISLTQAITIAEDHLRLWAIDATFRAHSGMDWERGRWVWELEFRGPNGRPVYEFYICVNLGTVIKFEADGSSGSGQRPGTRPPAQRPPQGQEPPAAGQRPTNPAVSLQDAIAIAEAHLRSRGINATFRSHSGMDWERGRWVWELEFRGPNGRPIHEFYICVNTGEIVKFETERS